MTITNNIYTASNSQIQPAPLAPDANSSGNIVGLSFKDILDTINPLQHIPVVSSLYRAATGSTISTGAKLAGDTIYGLALGGGTVGLATSVGSSVADIAVEQASGKDVSQHVVGALSSITAPDTTAATLVADNSTIVLPSAPQNNAPVFFPMDRNPAKTSGEYHHVELMDDINKKLVNAVS